MEPISARSFTEHQDILERKKGQSKYNVRTRKALVKKISTETLVREVAGMDCQNRYQNKHKRKKEEEEAEEVGGRREKKKKKKKKKKGTFSTLRSTRTPPILRKTRLSGSRSLMVLSTRLPNK